MTEQRWPKIRQIFDHAAELPAEKRAAYVEASFPGDPDARQEVFRLLAAADLSEGFMEVPAVNLDRVLQGPATAAARKRETLGGRYVLVDQLGKGGFADVYLATDEQLESRPVVVKILRHRASDDAWRQRHFLQEREALARMNHPGVVGILDTGQTPDGFPYLVMQYVPGVPLRDLLNKGPLPLDRALRLADLMGHALTAAHRQGILHRDLKPENVIILDHGGDHWSPVIIDFGISSLVSSTSPSVPQGTAVVGTQGYMAPEQAVGKPLPASDIYALGLIAYEMITGLVYQAQAAPDWSRVPKPLRSAIRKAVEWAPEKRWEQAEQFGDALASAGARRDNPQGFRIPLRALGLTTGLAALLAAGWSAWRLNSPVPVLPAVRSIAVGSLAPGSGPEIWGRPVVFRDAMRFRAGERVRLSFASFQAGHLYLVNESRSKQGELLFQLIFPAPDAHRLWTSKVHGPVVVPGTVGDWIQFDGASPEETVWLVWSASPVQLLEGLAQSAMNSAGRLEGRSATAFTGWTAASSSAQPEVEERGRLVSLKAAGDLLVRRLVWTRDSP